MSNTSSDSMKRKLLRVVNRYAGSILISGVYFLGKIADMFLPKRTATVSDGADLNNILLIKLVGLGDTVLMLPGIKKIKEYYPNAKILVLTTPLASGILTGQPFIDEVIIYDIFGKDKGVSGFYRIISKLRKEKIDIVIDYEQHIKLHTIISYCSGASRIIGFDNDIIKRGRLLTDRIILDGDKHMLESFNDLLRPLGIDILQNKLEKIFVSEKDIKHVDDWMRSHGIKNDDLTVGIHIGSGDRAQSRRWSTQRFAEIADGISQEYQAKVVFTGTKAELALINEVSKLMKSTPIISAGDFSIKQFAVLVAHFSLFISNDTGPMHISAAMGTSTIALFGPQDPVRYKPVGSGHYTIYKAASCSPCINVHYGVVPECTSHNYMECMNNIGVDDVRQAIYLCLDKNKRTIVTG